VFRRTLIAALTLPALLSTAPGCELAQAGEEGRLSFRLDAASGAVPLPFGTPLAVGLDVDVRVEAADATAGNVNLTGATSEAPDVVEVVGESGTRLTLRALRAGSAHIRVSSSLGEDGFTVTAADIAAVELKAPGILVPDNPASALIAGGTARVFVTLKDAVGRPLAAGGVPPITVTPEGAGAALPSEEPGFVRVRADTPGTLTMTPERGESLTLEVIASDAVTGLDLRGAGLGTLRVGATVPIGLRGTTDAAQTVVGLADDAALTGTPGVCSVAERPNLGEGVFEIRAEAAGACTVSATFGALTTSSQIEITP
jgi:hypothetical protein